MAEILRDRCLTDVAVSGATDCPDIFAGYAKLCDQPESRPRRPTDSPSAAQVKGKADAGAVKEARAEAAARARRSPPSSPPTSRPTPAAAR
jgi:hypothetical protein